MSNTVKLTIDGKEIEVAEGTNLIDAAEVAGIHIPNLCYMKGMKGIGACRLCLVDIEGMKTPMIACNTKVKEAMKVATSSEKIKETRKFVIDLVLSMHPLDCMTCTKAGVCRLQSYAYDFEIKESSFTRKKFGYPTDEANPFIKRDPEYCILCGKCVRVCKGQGTNVLDFMGRGVGARVITANDKPLQESACTFCGSCVDACPVNALLETDRWRKGREWDYDKVNSVCTLCGNACETVISTKDGQVAKINAGAVDGSSEKYICAYGRFGFDCITADSRVTMPMKREDGRLVETSWEDALSIVAGKIKDSHNSASILSTAGILNEDALTLVKFADTAGIKNIDTTMSIYAKAEDMKASGNADLNNADVIVVVGLNPSQWTRVLPGIDAAVRRKVERGAKLIVINSESTGLGEVATLNLVGNEIVSIKAVIKAMIDKKAKASKELKSMVSDSQVSEAIEKAAELINNSKNAVILSAPSLFKSSSNMSLIKGTAVAVPFESNARGIALMGLASGEKGYKDIVSEHSELFYVVGEVPLSKRPDTDFLVVQSSHMTSLAKEADVLLPSSAYLETPGTVVDYLGRLKYLPMAVEPQGEAMSHREIFIALAKIMKHTIKTPVEADVKKAMKVKRKPSINKFEKTEGLDVNAGEMFESINSSVINGSRLLWLRESAAVEK